MAALVSRKMPNLQIQRPFRKQLHPGNVFCLRYAQNLYFFGRIIALGVVFGGFPGGIRVHVYRKKSDSEVIPQGLIESDLLIAPQHINRLGFSRCYMPVVGNIPLCAADTRSDVCYYDAVRSRFVDESGQVLDRRRAIVGEYGMGNYRTMDDQISRALGLPLAMD